MMTDKIPAEEREDFYKSKFKYYRKVSAIAAIITGFAEMTYFVSDCMIFGRFATETLIPRLSVIIPLLLIVLFDRKVEDYKMGAALYYLLAHWSMWATIWAIWFLPNKDFAREGFIIMHYAFLCVGLAIPLKLHIPIHAFVMVNIIVSNLFNHYEHVDMMLTLALPIYIAACFMLYVFESSYADQYLVRKQIEKTSITDSLTEVYNRNKLGEIVKPENEQLKIGHAIDVVVLMLDIDNFKNVNDTYGHDAGDKILVFFADKIKSCIRSTDIVIRWGGEEFVVLLVGAELRVGLNIAEHIRTAVESGDNGVCPVSVSIGVSRYDGGNYHEAVKHADEALYYAKKHGRNMVISYDDINQKA